MLDEELFCTLYFSCDVIRKQHYLTPCIKVSKNPIVLASNPNDNNIFPWFFPLFSRTLGQFQSNLTQSIVFKFEGTLSSRKGGEGVGNRKIFEIYTIVTFHKSFFYNHLAKFQPLLGFYTISTIFPTCNGR